MIETDKIDIIGISLAKGDDLSISLEFDRNGTVNRFDDGIYKECMVHGCTSVDLFNEVIALISEELLKCRGAYSYPNKSGAACRFVIRFCDYDEDNDWSVYYEYGSESQKPDKPVWDFFENCLKLTNHLVEGQGLREGGMS